LSAIVSDSQITAQIRSARFEAIIGQGFNADLHGASRGIFRSRDAEFRAGRGFRRQIESIRLHAGGIGRIIDTNIERRAAKERSDWNVNVLKDRRLPRGSAGFALPSFVEATVVNLAPVRVAQGFVGLIQFLHFPHGFPRLMVSVGVKSGRERAVSRLDF
jgi:hypothetical protein